MDIHASHEFKIGSLLQQTKIKKIKKLHPKSKDRLRNTPGVNLPSPGAHACQFAPYLASE